MGNFIKSTAFGLLAIFVGSSLSACGPIRSGGLLIDASAELSAAQTAQAPKRAPYEYWAAHSYLRKAREDHSYANYETAELFAGKSVSCSRLARAIAERSARKDMGARELNIPEGLFCPVGTKKARANRAMQQDQLHRKAEDVLPEPIDPAPSEPQVDPTPSPVPEPLPPGDEPLPPGDDD